MALGLFCSGSTGLFRFVSFLFFFSLCMNTLRLLGTPTALYARVCLPCAERNEHVG